ncbi:unnamed protein product [Didymodactylos carnosus]|uniref:SHSP domain-containing protein n=1 Tax=Didymodactylos carnosus TaxID=1234261 RepID=A0A813UDH5_9BILA|nr:unnamed protein product [Didymodactylos carnosus]
MMMSSSSSSTQRPLGLSVEELFALDRQYRRIEQQQHLQQLQQQAQARQNTLNSNLNRHTSRSLDVMISNDYPNTTATVRPSVTTTNTQQQQRPPPLRYEPLPSLEIQGHGFRSGQNETTNTKSSYDNYTAGKPYWKDRPDYHTRPSPLQVNLLHHAPQPREETQHHYQRSHSIDQLTDYRHRDNVLPSQYTTNTDPYRTLYDTRTIGSARHPNVITNDVIDTTSRTLSARTPHHSSAGVSSNNFEQSNTTNYDPRSVYANRSQWGNTSSNGKLSSAQFGNTIITEDYDAPPSSSQYPRSHANTNGRHLLESSIPSSTVNPMSNHQSHSHYSTTIYDSPVYTSDIHNSGDNRASCKLRRQHPIKRESSRKIVVRPVIQRRREPSVSSSCESLDGDRQDPSSRTNMADYHNSLNDRTNLENLRQSYTNCAPTTPTFPESTVSNRFNSQKQTSARPHVQLPSHLNGLDRPSNFNDVLLNGSNTVCDDVSDTENSPGHRSYLTDNDDDSEDSVIELNLYEQRLHIGKSYDTNDISVQLEGPKILIHCHTIEPTDRRGNYRKHEFKTELFVPEVVDDETIVSYLTEDGILIVEGKYHPWAWKEIKKQRILEKQSEKKQQSVPASTDLLLRRSSSSPLILNNQNETNNPTRSEVDQIFQSIFAHFVGLEKEMTKVNNTLQPPVVQMLPTSETNSNKVLTQNNTNHRYFLSSSSSHTEDKNEEKPSIMTATHVNDDQRINNRG